MFDKPTFQREVATASEAPVASDATLRAKRERGLAFVIEPRDDQNRDHVDQVVSRLSDRVVVRPIDEPGADGARDAGPSSGRRHSTLVVTLRGVAFDDVSASPWDIAHAVRTEGKFLRVVPDVPVPVAADEEPSKGGGGGVTYSPGWEHDVMRVPQAWEVIRSHGRAPGTNVIIGHPDYGWLAHEVWDKGNLREEWDRPWVRNTIESETRRGGRTALRGVDPCTGPQKGHGLATASVMVAPLTNPRRAMTGVAPASVVMPIRAVDNVILHPTQGEVAAAIRSAVAAGCRVISLSLGGYVLGLSNLRDAIREAISKNVIVVAASGNYLWFSSYVTVEPAAWSEVIGVAGVEKTAKGYRPWGHSSREPRGSITISAPAAPVMRAVGGDMKYATSEGTSYATAFVAGVAALWLSRHFPNGYPSGGMTAQECFRKYLRQTASPTATDPKEADPYFGGLVNAERLMLETPNTAGVASTVSTLESPTSVDDLARVLGLPGGEQAHALLAAALLGERAPVDSSALAPWADEVLFLLQRHHELYTELTQRASDSALTPETLRVSLSPVASSALRRQMSTAATGGQ